MVMSTTSLLRLGTRGSLLAWSQSQIVANAIEARHRGTRVEVVIYRTTGDDIVDRPLDTLGGKGLFTRELEQALLRGEVDFAVHSYKDVPVTMPLVDQSELAIAAVPLREDARDCLVCSTAKSLLDLPKHAKVGTGSLRRKCQILELRPDLHVEMLRGNIDTRIKKYRHGDLDAIVLAQAGLHRAGLFDSSFMTPIPIEHLLPSPSQGALALQCRRDDHATQRLLLALNHPDTALCCQLERAVIHGLDGDCHSPIAAYAHAIGGLITLRAVVGGQGNHPPVIKATATASIAHAASLPQLILDELFAKGAKTLLHSRQD